jgi:hypothetical protein
MDKEKMAEGRRRVAEQRRAEEEQREAEEETRRVEKEKQEQQRREEWEKKQLAPAVIRDFEQLEVQLKTFYEELSILSKKSPDGKMNKFKLKFVNDTLKKTNAILGDSHRPFPDFELFSDEDLPSSSDAVLMLSHYLKSMERFRNDHSHWMGTGIHGVNVWCKKGDPLPDEKEKKDSDKTSSVKSWSVGH